MSFSTETAIAVFFAIFCFAIFFATVSALQNVTCTPGRATEIKIAVYVLFPVLCKTVVVLETLLAVTTYVRRLRLTQNPGGTAARLHMRWEGERWPGSLLRFFYPLRRRYDFCCIRISSTYVVGLDIENFQRSSY